METELQDRHRNEDWSTTFRARPDSIGILAECILITSRPKVYNTLCECEPLRNCWSGELEYRRSNYTRTFESLRKAVDFDDALRYTEPWGWMVPTRHAYAALMLEQGKLEEATEAYAVDLGLGGSLTRAHQHPNNVWALYEYHECLVRLHRGPEARIIKQALNLAAQLADVPVQCSCFCRLGALGPDNQETCCK